MVAGHGVVKLPGKSLNSAGWRSSLYIERHCFWWTEFYTGMLASRSNTLAIYMPFWQKRHRFGIPSIDESYSFPVRVTPCDDLYGEAPPEWGILGLHHQNHTNIGKTKFFHPVVFAAKVVYNNINNNNYNYNNNN